MDGLTFFSDGEFAADIIQTVVFALAVEGTFDSDITAVGVLHISSFKLGFQSISTMLEESVVCGDFSASDGVFCIGIVF